MTAEGSRGPPPAGQLGARVACGLPRRVGDVYRTARRYPVDMSPFIAMPDQPDQETLRDVAVPLPWACKRPWLETVTTLVSLEE